MKDLLRDFRIRRLLLANTLGSIGAGVTIFAVPWLLVQQPAGSQAFRWATIGTTIVLFAIMPHYGAWVDRHSRKTALLASEAWGFTAMLGLTAAGLAAGGFGVALLVATYFCGMLYYTLHYPARFALMQQLFDRSQYQSLTGLLEIQGQTAMMIAGGLGGLLIEHVPLWTILLFNAATYLTSFVIQATLPYAATHVVTPTSLPAAGMPAGTRRYSVWSAIAEGWQWLRDRPRLTIFFTCSLMPFVIVMTANYLFPVYVTETLRASAAYFAGGEICFAAGAIVAGFMLPRLLAQHSASATIPVAMLVFGAGLLILIFLRLPIPYLIAGALLGFGNAGCRVARNTLLLHVVPVEMMGRVSSFYNVVDRVLRTALVFAMGIIDVHGPPAGFMLLTLVLLVALYGVWHSRAALREPLAVALAPA